VNPHGSVQMMMFAKEILKTPTGAEKERSKQ
jgi:hypothetical protein